MDINKTLRKLAKSIPAQNLLLFVKEIPSLKIFRNDTDLSKIQEIYLSYLYFYDVISNDIKINKISKHVLDNESYEDSYMLWKKEKGFKQEEKNKSDIKLVAGNKIKFPNKKEN